MRLAHVQTADISDQVSALTVQPYRWPTLCVEARSISCGLSCGGLLFLVESGANYIRAISRAHTAGLWSV